MHNHHPAVSIYFIIKTALFFVAGSVLIYCLIGSYASKMGLCYISEENLKTCMVPRHFVYGNPVFFSARAIVIAMTLVVLFSISNRTFTRWLIFLAIWFILNIFFIVQAPTTSDYFNISPTKETVSLYMGYILMHVSWIWFLLSKTHITLWKKWLIAIPVFLVAFVVTVVM